MSRPYVDPRAGALLDRYLATFGGPDVPVPVESIAEDLLGLRISERDGLACSGLLVPARREILVNAREAAESEGRKRFTIAHELGHWVCQVLEGRWLPVFCRAVEAPNGKNPPEEREANVFAAELLMPEAAVRAAFGAHGSTAETAAALRVSQEALGWRLYNLGLVSDPPQG